MATASVDTMMNVVMATNLFWGMGSSTWSSLDLLEKNREFMLTRQGKIIRGKLTITDTEKPTRESKETKITTIDHFILLIMYIPSRKKKEFNK